MIDVIDADRDPWPATFRRCIPPSPMSWAKESRTFGLPFRFRLDPIFRLGPNPYRLTFIRVYLC